MDAEEIAEGILKREGNEGISYRVADPGIFQKAPRMGGPSIAERMMRAGVRFQRGDNSRIGKKGAMGGWDQMRARLKGVDGVPSMYFFNTCTDSIRTIPALQHDEARPEDLDTTAEDHAADEVRYAVMSRPWTREKPKDPNIRHIEIDTRMPTFNELVEANRRKRLGEEEEGW